MKTVKAKYGETFDTLAYKYYGNEKLAHIIMQANPQLRKKVFFDGLYEVQIPEIDNLEIEETTAPWKK
jgi:phage tail protein X